VQCRVTVTFPSTQKAVLHSGVGPIKADHTSGPYCRELLTTRGQLDRGSQSEGKWIIELIGVARWHEFDVNDEL
jgi:hypothetical protein